MKFRTSRTAPATLVLAASALALAACGGGAGADEPGGSEPAASSATAAVSVNPDAPELAQRDGAYNFVRSDDDGRTSVLGHVTVRTDATGGWLGLADGDIDFTALADGDYRVIARGASGCPGVGATTDEGLGTIGEIHATGSAAKVWGTPAKIDAANLSTVVLADSSDTVLACGKSVSWTEPSAQAPAAQ